MTVVQRSIRNSTVLFKQETTQNTDAAPTAAEAVMVLTGWDYQPDFRPVDRELAKPYMGNSPRLAGTKLGNLKGRHELAGSGTAGTAPKWDSLMQALGFAAAVLTTPARVEYTPISTGFKAGTSWVYGDGSLYKNVGMMGTATLDFSVGQTPKADLDLTGLYTGVSAATLGSVPAFTGWQAPVVVTPIAATDITLGGTYSAGAVSGGTIYPSRGLQITLANDVQFIELASDQFMTIADRKPTAKITLNLTAAQEVALVQGCENPVPTTLAFTAGNAAGNIFMIFAPAAVLMNPKTENVQGLRMTTFDVDLCPGGGNDDIRFILK